MPNIYDIAEKRQGNRMNPIEAAMQGEEWRTQQKARELNVEAADINLDVARSTQDEFNANAGSRKQAQMIADNVAKHAEVGRVLSSGLNKEIYESGAAKTLQGLMPEAEFPDSWEEAQDELAQWQPYFDEQYGAQKKIESYRERADKGDKTAAAIIAGLEAEQADKLNTAALKAAKLEQEIATGRANEVKGYAQAGKADAEAQAALMNPGSTGGRGTARERANASLEQSLAIMQERDLTPAEKTNLANTIDYLHPDRTIARTLPNGTILIKTDRPGIPESLRPIAKEVMGDGFSRREIEGKGVLTAKEMSDARHNARAFKKTSEIIEPLLKEVDSLPDYYFGGVGSAAKGVAYAVEAMPGKNDKAEEFNKKKKSFENQITALIAAGREMTGEGKAASNADLTRLEELVGRGIFESKSSVKEALKSFKEMAERERMSYAEMLSGADDGSSDEEEIEDAESWVNN